MPQGINANLKYSRKNPQHDLELLKKIGSGTYGEVYHVSQTVLILEEFSFSESKQHVVEFFHVKNHMFLNPYVFQARYIETGAETAVKIVKIDQGTFLINPWHCVSL